MKVTYQDYLNNDCTLQEFKNTLNLVKPQLGKVYRQTDSSWSEKHFKIIFQIYDVHYLAAI